MKTAIWLVPFLLFWSQAPRDTRQGATPAPSGSATLSGSVISDDAAATPMRGAVVTLQGDGLPGGRGVVADNDGRFAFHDLPAGHFTVTARKNAYLPSSAGAKRAGGPGAAISVAKGQTIADVTIRLARGAVITGALRDESGAPLPDQAVMARRVGDKTPAPWLMSAPLPTTDDRGVYRIYGLAPGDYIVLTAASAFRGSSEVTSRSEARVDAILQSLQQRQPRLGGSTPSAADAPAPAREPTVAYAPIFYPGTAVFADAERVHVAAGEEHGNVDFTVAAVPTSAIDGVITGSVSPLPRVTLWIDPVGDGLAALGNSLLSVTPSLTLAPGPDGRFHYANVLPGRYVIAARSADEFWATADVTIAPGQDQQIALALQPPMRLRGRVAFDNGSVSADPDPRSIRVTVFATDRVFNASANGTILGRASIPQASPREDGTFEVAGVLGGTYSIAGTIPPPTAPARVTAPAADPNAAGPDLPPATEAWWLRSAVVNGRDVLDLPLEIGASGDINGVVLMFSNRHTELSGTIQTANGGAAPDYTVVVFPADRALWRPGARRVQFTHAATDGAFVIKDLPGGDYLFAALTDLDPSNLDSPAFLDQIAAAAITLSLKDGERKRQDIRLAN